MSTGCKFTQIEAANRLKVLGIEMLEPYKNAQTPILMRGPCGHELKRRPAGILFDGDGCRECAPNRQLSQKEAARRFNMQGLVVLEPYKNSSTLVLARCGRCAREWKANPSDVFGGHGCQKCGKSLPLTQCEAADRFQIYGITMIEPYVGVDTPILVRGKCGHQWKPRPHNIFNGSGCPWCPKDALFGFQKNKSAILYYLRVANPFSKPVYKIGITNRTIKERFGPDIGKIVIVEIWHFQNGIEAYEMEQDILNDHDADRYTGPDILKTGNDELFNLDVLGLDRGRGQLELVA